MTNPFPERPFEDEGVLRTDEQQDPATRYTQAEAQFNPNDPPTQMPTNQKSHNRQFRQKDDLQTELEMEDPSKAVRDAYQDS